MESYQILIGILTPFFGTILGSTIVFFMKEKINDKVQKGLLGIASGVMISASFFSLISPALEMSYNLKLIPWIVLTIGFLGGGILLFIGDKVFDKLKEEGCFIPNPEDSRYKEISKLNVSNEKKIKVYEAYKKLCDEWTEYGNIKLEVVNDKIQITSWEKSSTEEHKILLNMDNTIDNLVNAWGDKIKFGTEEELIRMWLFVNYLRTTWWKESTDAAHKKDPFVLGSPLKLWDDIQFMAPWEAKKVLSSAVPFFSEMAKKFPTIEEGNKREFLVKYLNNLWEKEHTTS